MTLDIVLTVIGAILIVIGILGCVLPVLPGVPLSYIAIVLLHLTSRVDFSTEFLIGWGIVVIIVQVLDYYVPIWGTKKFGGTRWGMYGSGLGLIAGLFLGPFGIFIGAFAGAFIGEYLNDKDSGRAFKAAVGSFVGLMAGIVVKVLLCLAMLVVACIAIFQNI